MSYLPAGNHQAFPITCLRVGFFSVCQKENVSPGRMISVFSCPQASYRLRILLSCRIWSCPVSFLYSGESSGSAEPVVSG